MGKQKKKKRPAEAGVLPPKPTGGHGNFNVPMTKSTFVAKSKKVRKKI